MRIYRIGIGDDGLLRFLGEETSSDPTPAPAPVPRVFAPPTIHVATFDTWWDGFENLAGGDPDTRGNMMIRRRPGLVEIGYGPSAQNQAAHFGYRFGARGRVVMRATFAWRGTLPDNAAKFFQFYQPRSVWQPGGLNFDQTGGRQLSWSWATSSPGHIGNRLLVTVSPGELHTLEVELDGDWGMVRFWLDGRPVDVLAGGDNTFDPASGWLLNGGGPIGDVDRVAFLDTITGPTTSTGVIAIHEVAVSNRRIGP